MPPSKNAECRFCRFLLLYIVIGIPTMSGRSAEFPLLHSSFNSPFRIQHSAIYNHIHHLHRNEKLKTKSEKLQLKAKSVLNFTLWLYTFRFTLYTSIYTTSFFTPLEIYDVRKHTPSKLYIAFHRSDF